MHKPKTHISFPSQVYPGPLQLLQFALQDRHGSWVGQLEQVLTFCQHVIVLRLPVASEILGRNRREMRERSGQRKREMRGQRDEQRE